MKSCLIKLIQEHNTPEKGILTIENVENYVNKLLENAEVIPYYSERRIKAFIAFYANAPKKDKAFLTLILVSQEMQGRKIGKFLLDFSIKVLTEKGFKEYDLEVLKQNEKALKLYENFGFELVGEKELFYIMRKKL